jgi:hypothetical protein
VKENEDKETADTKYEYEVTVQYSSCELEKKERQNSIDYKGQSLIAHKYIMPSMLGLKGPVRQPRQQRGQPRH